MTIDENTALQPRGYATTLLRLYIFALPFVFLPGVVLTAFLGFQFLGPILIVLGLLGPPVSAFRLMGKTVTEAYADQDGLEVKLNSVDDFLRKRKWSLALEDSDLRIYKPLKGQFFLWLMSTTLAVQVYDSERVITVVGPQFLTNMIEETPRQ